MKLINRSLTVAGALVASAFLVPTAFAQDDVAGQVTAAIEADSSKLCEIITQAIEAGGDVKTIVKAAVLVAPEESAAIAECAIAAAPEAEGAIKEGLEEAFSDVESEMAAAPLDIRGIYMIPPVAASAASVQEGQLSFQQLLETASDEGLSFDELVELLLANRDGLPRRQTGSPSNQR
ncbi:MAG: hypothetical protein P8J87_09710 [Verrucomicrobiales bacterium]|nr:hypothetical protein [Verrucomicrobiales bacterium]